MIKKNHHQYLLRDYWFWRDSQGHEIDLLTRRSGGFHIFEIKSTQTILPKLFAGIVSELAGDKVKLSTLVYGGNNPHDRTDYLVRTWEETE